LGNFKGHIQIYWWFFYSPEGRQ